MGVRKNSLVGLGDCKERNSARRRKAVDEEEEDDDGGRGQGGYSSQSSARVFKVPMILVL